MNKIILIGNVGNDPEILSFDNGGKMAKFAVATTEHWNDKQGQRVERTTWHMIQVTKPGLIDVVEKWVKKGMKLCIDGSYQSRDWVDQNETKHRAYFVSTESFEMLSKPKMVGDAPGNSIIENGDDDLPF